jgi:membrane associated rhomboid family serine protease
LIEIGVVTGTEEGGVAYMAHIGGTVFGAVAARLFERHDPLP